MTREELQEKLAAMFDRLHSNGGQIQLTILGKTIGIEIPKGCSYATIDKLLCDAIERIDRMLAHDA